MTHLPDRSKAKKMHTALSVKGVILGIPLEASIAHGDDKNTLSGSFTLTVSTLIQLLNAIQSGMGDHFKQSPLYSFAQALQGEGVIVWQSGGSFVAAGQTDHASIGIIHQDGGTLLLLATVDKVCPENDDFGDFLKRLQKTLGAVDFRFAYKSCSGITFSKGDELIQKLERLIFDQPEGSFVLPDRKELNNASVLVFAEVDLDKSDMGFLNTLKKVLPDETSISLTAVFGDQFFALLRVEHDPPVLEDGKLDIRKLDCSLYLSGAPVFSLSGDLALRINGAEYLFIINSSVKGAEFSISAEYTDAENPISVGGRFKLYQLGISVGYGLGGVAFGGWGMVRLEGLDLFALAFMRNLVGAADLTALGLSFDKMDLSALLSVFGIDLPGAEQFSFLSIERFPLVANNMDTSVFDDLSEDGRQRIADAFSQACGGVCGGRAPFPVAAEAILVRQSGDGWMLTDKNNVRHYSISRQGSVLLSPQLYFCADDSIQAGGYILYKGLFVCASLVVLGVNQNLFLEVTDNIGAEALVNVTPIDLGWLKLKRAKQDKRRSMTRTPASNENSLVEQYIYDGDGPTLYLCMKRNDFVFYLDASLELLGMIELDAYLLIESGEFHLDAGLDFFGLSARITLVADHDVNSGSLLFTIMLDLSFFQNIADDVVQTVKRFVSEVLSELSSAQAQLDYAQNQVLGLRAQIDRVDCQIADHSRQLRGLRWWQFYKAPYLLVEIGGLELEKAGIYVAMGAACTALEIAKQVLQLLKEAGGEVGWLIQKLAEAISAIFYLKSISLTLGAKTADKLRADMQVCFTLFGRDYEAGTEVSLTGDVKNNIDSRARGEVSHKTDEELDKMKAAQALMLNAQDALERSLADSDFPYDDCDGYKRCINDGLSFADKAAASQGMMEAAYSIGYGTDDPLTEYHSGQMYKRLTEVKAQWQGTFSAVREIDCGGLLSEARKLLSEANSSALDELDKRWESLKDFQTFIDQQSGRISGLDTHYLSGKERAKALYSDAFMSENGRISGGGPADNYCAHLSRVFLNSADTALGVNAGGFITEDSEDYFINPANEPILDDLFAQLCADSPSEKMRGMAGGAKNNAERKRSAVNYRIRI